MDDRLINQAVAFLNHPNVRGVEKEKQVAFLKKKNLTDEQIEKAFELQRKGEKTQVTIPSDTTPTKSTESTHLNLRKTGLTQLPDLSPYLNITILNVSLNQLAALPAEIGKLRNLATFNAQQNLLTNAGLPAEFFELEHLKDVNLAFNKLTSLANFHHFAALVKLNVSGNEIEEVSDDVVNLQSLEVLLLHNNKLTTVSPCLALVTSLKQIVLLI